MSVCPKCGADLDVGAKFCVECGAPVPQVKKCVQCGASLPLNVKFCNECGAKQDSAASASTGFQMGDKNVVAGDVIGAKIAGDSVGHKIMGNAIYNTIEDETKKVLSCSICGKHLTNDNAYTCPKCKKTVCSEHFDSSFRCCSDCARKEKGEIIVDKRGLGDVSTIADALSIVKENGTVKIKYGYYEENIVVDKNLTIVGEADDYGELPVICGNVQKAPNTIEIKAHATLKNLSVITKDENSGEELQGDVGNGIVVYCDSSVIACVVRSNAKNGILVKEGNPIISDSSVYNNLSSGIRINAGASGRIERCDIYGNEMEGVSVCGEGSNPFIKDCNIHDGKANGVVFSDGAQGFVEKNEIFKNEQSGILIQNAVQDGSTTNPTIKKNNIYRNSKNGIDVKTGSCGIVENCEIFENKVAGISVQGIKAHPLIKGCNIHKGSQYGIAFQDKAQGEITSCDIFESEYSELFLCGAEVKPSISNCKIHKGKKYGVFIADGACGNLTECEVFENVDTGVILQDPETSPSIKNCKIYNNRNGGAFIKCGSLGSFEKCSIFRNNGFGNIIIEDENTNPTIVQCEIYDFNDWQNAIQHKSGSILIRSGALGVVRQCDIYKNNPLGICIQGEKTNPTIPECKIHNNQHGGVLIKEAALGSIENCDVFENGIPGNISIEDRNTNPTIKKCRIYDGEMCGVNIKMGAQGSLIECDIFKNKDLDGVLIQDSGTKPSLVECSIRDGKVGVLICKGAESIIKKCRLENNIEGDLLGNNPGPNTIVENSLMWGKIYSLKNGQWIQDEEIGKDDVETTLNDILKDIESKQSEKKETVEQKQTQTSKIEIKSQKNAVQQQNSNNEKDYNDAVQYLKKIGISVGSFKDERDGNEYKTISIGKQTWMAEPLRYVEKQGLCSLEQCVTQNKNGTFLYTWAAAMKQSKNIVSPYLGSRIFASGLTLLMCMVLGFILYCFIDFTSIWDYILYWIIAIAYLLFVGTTLVIKLSPRANNEVDGGYFGILLPLLIGVVSAFIYSDSLFWDIWLCVSAFASSYSFRFMANAVSFPVFIKSIAPNNWKIPSERDVKKLAKYLVKYTEVNKNAFADIQKAIRIASHDNFMSYNFWLDKLIYNDDKCSASRINTSYASNETIGAISICKRIDAVRPVVCIKK